MCDRRKKRTLILISVICAVALIVLLFYAHYRTRPLQDVCAMEHWESIGGIEAWNGGIGGYALPDDDVSLEELKEILWDTPVRRTETTTSIPHRCVQFWIQTSDGEVCNLYIGENGEFHMQQGPMDKLRTTCWVTDSQGVYDEVLALLTE